jgi:hypothetical protein
MKKITFKKYKFGWKEKGLAILFALILFIGSMVALFKGLNDWFNSHTIKFNQIIVLQINKPYEILNREVATKDIIKEIEVPDIANLTPIEKYICDDKHWGLLNCQVALAIAKSESGMREDAFNTYNKNGTLDVGIFQVNSSHFNQSGCSLKELVDQYKNVDCAYNIYKASGWNAWSSFNSGSFKDVIGSLK